MKRSYGDFFCVLLVRRLKTDLSASITMRLMEENKKVSYRDTMVEVNNYNITLVVNPLDSLQVTSFLRTPSGNFIKLLKTGLSYHAVIRFYRLMFFIDVNRYASLIRKGCSFEFM